MNFHEKGKWAYRADIKPRFSYVYKIIEYTQLATAGTLYNSEEKAINALIKFHQQWIKEYQEDLKVLQEKIKFIPVEE